MWSMSDLRGSDRDSASSLVLEGKARVRQTRSGGESDRVRASLPKRTAQFEEQIVLHAHEFDGPASTRPEAFPRGIRHALEIHSRDGVTCNSAIICSYRCRRSVQILRRL